VAFATPGAATATLFFEVHPVAERLEVALRDPAHLARIELRVAMQAETPLVAALVEMDVRQHLARAARAAGDREAVVVGERPAHCPTSPTSPSSASSCSMWSRCVAGQ